MMPKVLPYLLTISSLLLTISCAPAPRAKLAWHNEFESTPAPQLQLPGQGGALHNSPDLPVITIEPPLRPSDFEIPAEAWQEPEDTGASVTLQWPIPTTGVTSLYGARKDPIDGRKRFHYGVDLQAEYGVVIQACAKGRVIRARRHRGHGRQVILRHPGGYTTVYSHLSQILVQPGDSVGNGQPIGRVGNSGRSTGPHLHLEVHHRGKHMDPLDILGVSAPP